MATVEVGILEGIEKGVPGGFRLLTDNAAVAATGELESAHGMPGPQLADPADPALGVQRTQLLTAPSTSSRTS